MPFHADLTDADVHVPFAWTYANAAARTGATGFVAADLYKLAHQSDDNSVWMLTVVTPTWVQVGGAAAFGAAGGDLTGTYPNPTVNIDGKATKATPVGADETFLADSAAAFATKKLTLTNLWAATWTAIAALAGKATPVDADTLVLSDSAAAAAGKSLTWANVKATLKTYFDTLYGTIAQAKAETLTLACSDETTVLTTGAGKVTFRMPWAMTVTEVRASLTTAQSSGNIFTVDINESGVSILSTKLTIDNTEKTSTTAVTAAVISDSALADDAEITIDIDQIGAGDAAGLKVTIIGTRA